MNDVLKRLGAVGTAVAETRIQVASIAATIPSLASGAVVNNIAATIPHLATKSAVDSIAAMIPHLATKADLYAMESKIIKWMIATVLTAVGLAFTIAKFVH